MGRYIRPDGTSAEVQPGLGVVAPRNLTARPMARPTGAQIAPQLAAQRARAAAEAQRQAEEEQARRRMYDECRRRGDYICGEAELGAAAGLGSGLSSDASQNLNCGHNEYVACDDSGYVTTCNCYPMSQADIAHRDAAARRQEQQRQQQQQQQQARQRQQQANIAALARVRPRPATAALPLVQRTTRGLGVIAPRNLTAQPMARPTGNQIAAQLAAQRAAAAAAEQRRREAAAREQAAADARRYACQTGSPECYRSELA